MVPLPWRFKWTTVRSGLENEIRCLESASVFRSGPDPTRGPRARAEARRTRSPLPQSHPLLPFDVPHTISPSRKRPPAPLHRSRRKPGSTLRSRRKAGRPDTIGFQTPISGLGVSDHIRPVDDTRLVGFRTGRAGRPAGRRSRDDVGRQSNHDPHSGLSECNSDSSFAGLPAPPLPLDLRGPRSKSALLAECNQLLGGGGG